jgi:hypothetical protein
MVLSLKFEFSYQCFNLEMMLWVFKSKMMWIGLILGVVITMKQTMT